MLPSGNWANFDELVSALQDHWASVATDHQGVEEIKVIGIDLTKRARPPASEKKPVKRTATKKTKARSTTAKVCPT